jgi:CheY-like chemotaxis protein
LGLALSQRLMAAMDGRIGVESLVGEGSTFWIELPLAEAPAPLAAESAAPATVAVAGPARTVLLIDDNLANLRLVERILEIRPGITVLPALQGQLGLELARQHRPDLILLDLQLPDLPGEEVLRRLQGDPATERIPVIIFSADATPGQITRLRQAGAADYLTKPFRVAAFLELIDGMLARGAGVSALPLNEKEKK